MFGIGNKGSGACETSGRHGVRKRIRFYGQVQGVGFRYQATRAARSIGLTGWVRNEDDGTVLMEVQGPETGIGMLMMELENDRYIRIEDTDIRRIDPLPDERAFHVSGY